MAWLDAVPLLKQAVDLYDGKGAEEREVQQRIEAEQNVATQEAQVRVVQAQAQQRVAEAEGRARATEIEGRALAANPQVLRQREIERWNGQCPLDSETCVIGAGALVTTN